MKKFLNKIIHTVVPHEKNGNVPHLLKKEFIIVLIVFVGTLFYFSQNNFYIIKKLNLTAAVYPAVLADLANQDRAIQGVPTLAWNTTLENAAKLKAEDMLKNSYFAHTSPSGVTPWYWLQETKYDFIYAGENLAVDFTESVNVQNAWLNSPKHRENIMNSNFTEIGIATVDGFFEGKNTTFVVEFFGKPSQVKLETNPIASNTVIKEEKIITPGVAGVSTENIVKEEAKEDLNIKVIEETDKFIVVRNEDAIVESEPFLQDDLQTKPLSTWYERFLVNPTSAVRYIYITILSIIMISVLLMLSKQYQKHHTKHLVMGIILIGIITILLFVIYLNNVENFIN